ncbi:hypothetical protein D6T64_11900 [Cryobacterium melibiosiphilum]|uniref:Uncharacterized protein n=1 Tax=Cryobacterium melibiosiphilum TaxID=995039 RepID=A0A3A5MPU0_9MICO|nr:hypothetical protein [Cryobacterium melibiosiphilum]RJT88086.1 hypothetical protein D6T64_11900 [Cryobacterium melibiosiphilum]
MSRIRTTKQARECRRLAKHDAVKREWLALIADQVPDQLAFWATKDEGFEPAQAFLTKRAEMKRGES